MRIRTFRHKGLRRLYQLGEHRGLPSTLVTRVVDILAILEAAPNAPTIGTFPGLRLHRLKGDLAAVLVGISEWKLAHDLSG